MGVVELDAAKAAVRIVTDSTADLPTELATRHQIHVVPLSVTFGRDVYRDGVDLTPGSFYKMVRRRESTRALTGPPAQAEFLASYRMIIERSVVSVPSGGS
jgi:fatty acid-binding protein DegV